MMEIHLYAKNKSDAPVQRVIQKHVTSRSNVTKAS